MNNILVIEDEESISMALNDDLTLEGYHVTIANDGENGLKLAKNEKFDLIILDIMLPKLNGFEVCKRLRVDKIDTPIIMLTAKSQEIDKVVGLELGADDYLTKPFSPRELLARVKAILRRTKVIIGVNETTQFGDFEIDFKKHELRKQGRLIYLTALEFDLLHFFLTHIDQVVNRDEILNKVWGEDIYVYPRTVDTHIAHLRKKIEDDPVNPQHLLNVRGVGYKFVL